MQENVLVQKVEAGIEYLNENHPGWRDKIDVERLDIYSCEDCIVGQLDIDVDMLDEFGRDYPPQLGMDGDDEEYAELTRIWKEKLSI